MSKAWAKYKNGEEMDVKTVEYCQLIVDLKDDEDTANTLRNLDSSLRSILITQITPVGENTNFVPFAMRRLRNSVAEKYFSNSFMSYTLNTDASSWCDIIQEEDDEYSHLTQSCLAKAIWRNYQESYNKYYSARKDPVLSSKRLTMASLVKTCLDQEYIIGNEVEMTPDQAIKWFAVNNLGIEFYSNADNKLLLKYHPEQFNRNIKPSILRIIYHSEHIERIAEMKSFEKNS